MSKTQISIIAAVDRNFLIGSDKGMPWIIPEDLAYFKNVTLGHTIVMGGNTFRTLGKTLPQRENLVLSRNLKKTGTPDLKVFSSFEELLSYLKQKKANKIFIIGGEKIFRQFLNHTDTLYLTFINKEYKGNAYFPEINFLHWELVAKIKGKSVSKPELDFYFLKYLKK